MRLAYPKGTKPETCPNCGSVNITGSRDAKMWRCNSCEFEWEACYYRDKERPRKVKPMSPERLNELRRRASEVE